MKKGNIYLRPVVTDSYVWAVSIRHSPYYRWAYGDTARKALHQVAPMFCISWRKNKHKDSCYFDVTSSDLDVWLYCPLGAHYFDK